jgi:putative OPT family oligopeptide transporter
MTICTVLVTGGILLLFGFTGTEGMVATLGVAGIVCCVCCTSGDIGNDLKTGYIVGASPRNQQIMQILGVVVASFIMAPVLIAIHEGSLNAGTGGIGGRELPAPQAGMFAAIANGFFGEGKLPWNMLGWGVGIGVLVLIADTLLKNAGSKIRLHVMPVAVGIYLPIGLTAPMLIGGMIRGMVTRAKGMNGVRSEKRGVLIASGIIAGESVLGVVLAILAYFHITSLKWGAALSPTMLEVVSVGALFAFLIWMYRTSLTKN